MKSIEFGLNQASQKTYFIADIAANHDGSLKRAKKLIKLAAESGADAAKFQNFQAKTIISQTGFDQLGSKLSHQASWKKSVFEVYNEAATPLEWTQELVKTCEESEIEYFTAPYDLNFIDYFAGQMPYFKIGSGDITWKSSIDRMLKSRLPIILATGASDIAEIDRAVALIEEAGIPYVLMQCNTNYTGSAENFENLNLAVIKSFQERYPKAVLGLSDHTPGDVAVLGAVTLGARVIEKHFTDDNSRLGPDHAFSLDPKAWSLMVKNTRTLESALGDGIKKVETNEKESRIIQRRALRYVRDLPEGHKLSFSDLSALRPCPPEALDPFEIDKLIGRELTSEVKKDQLASHRHHD